jgi:tryptophanyl-tRNA synthetase
MEDQIITPHVVSAKTKFNYNILIEQFGLKNITNELMTELKKFSGETHHFIDRGIFYAHQDFDRVLAAKKAGKEIYIYTGRGPSAEALHLGHLVPMLFTMWLQKIFDCWVVIEMSDEEKFYFKNGTLEEFISYTENNAKDIIACGFNPNKTFIFSSLKYEHFMRPLVTQINKKMTVHLANKIYGFDDENNIGQLSWASYEMAPSLCGAFPHLFGNRKDVLCLVPCAVDQVPYFRTTRDIAEALGYPKPALICSKFLVGLQGIDQKASSTDKIPPIFMNDTAAIVMNKIKKYAFSGGGETIKDHRSNGANLEVDVSYIYLTHFLEDTERLNAIAGLYKSGTLLTSEIKKIVIDLINKIIKKHNDDRMKITPELYEQFFTMFVQPIAKEYFEFFRKTYVNINIC